MERVLEPELMVDPAQALAYAEADFSDGNSAFVERFLAEFPDKSSGEIVDLGCGPADIPIRLVSALPEAKITAVDGSPAMLALGREAIERRGLTGRIRLHEGLVPDGRLPGHGYAAVLANSFTHHLPDAAAFWAEVKRLAAPRAAVLVQDLFRPDTIGQAHELVQRMSANDPAILQEDFFNSLCAAFTIDEVRDQLRAADLGQLRCEQVSERHWAAWGRV